MINANGEVMFCPGCPARSEFVDTVTEDTAATAITISTDQRGIYDVRVGLTFIDRDGGESRSVHAYLHKPDLENIGLELRRNDGGDLADKDRVGKSLERKTEVLKSTMVERIGRCANGACGLNCPAMAEETFAKILVSSVASQNEKKK